MALKIPGSSSNPIADKHDEGQGAYGDKNSRAEDFEQLKNLEALRDHPDAIAAREAIENQKDDVQKQEEGQGYLWDNKTTPQAPRAEKRSIGGVVKGNKKKALIGGLLSIIVVGIVSIVTLSPSLLVIHVVETITEGMNMQSGSMDVRTAKVYASMMKSTSGFCSSTVSVRCKFRSMKDDHIKKLEDAGIKVVLDEGETITGRKKVVALEFKGKEITASNLSKEIKSNPEFRSATRSAYNPRFAGFADKTFAATSKRLGISKASIFGANTKTDEERTKKLKEVTKEGQNAGDPGTKYTQDDDGKYHDEAGNEIDEETAKAHNDAVDTASELKKIVGDIDETEEKLTPKILSAADEALDNPAKHIDVKNVSVGLLGGAISAPDNACTVYGLVNAVSFGAKTIRSRQMARYAMVFLTTASAMKAGDISPEDAAYIGNLLTKTVNEEVKDSAGKVTTKVSKAATDSYGYRYVAYGDIGPLTPSATEFLAGGGLGGKITGIADSIINVIPGAKKDNKKTVSDACGIIKNPFVQVGSALLSVGLIFTGPVGWAALGTSLAAGVATGIGLEVLSSILTPIITDMVAGILIDNTTFGERAGDALVSGSGVIMSTVAGMGGNAPLRPEEAVAYMEGTQSEALALYKEEDRLTKSPFDLTSSNTFMGSIAAQFIPYVGKTSSLTTLGTTSFTVLSHSIKSILNPFTSAAEHTSSTYTQCDDEEYKRLELATDPFCNPIRGIPSQYLDDDPVDIITRLVVNESIDADTGSARTDTENGKRYSDFLKDCINREEPLGYTGENFDQDDGSKCFLEDSDDDGNTDGDITMTAQTKADWYVYTIDQRVLDGIDNGYVIGLNCGPTSGSSSGSGANDPGDAAKIDAAIKRAQENNPGTPHPLDGKGQAIVDIANKYNINARFIATTLQAESQFGADGSAGPAHNNFGFIKQNADSECAAFPVGPSLYNCYNTPESGIEAIMKVISNTSVYKDPVTDPAAGDVNAKPGSVAAVRAHYCPNWDGECNFDNFLKMSEAIDLPIKATDMVFLSSGGSANATLSGTTAVTKMPNDELMSLITSYGLPAPDQAAADELRANLTNNEKAGWAAQQFLNGEKIYKGKGGDIKEYLTTAWVWAETGAENGPDPYQANCHDTEGSGTAYQYCGSMYQVGGAQLGDHNGQITKLFQMIYGDSELTTVLDRTFENSSKATNESWDYHIDNGSLKQYAESRKTATIADLPPQSDYNSEKTQFLTALLAKDPTMAAALNSFAVSDGDLIAAIKAAGSDGYMYGSSFYDAGFRKTLSNMILALYDFDGKGPGAGTSSCSDNTARNGGGEGISVLWGGAGERNLDYGLGADAGLTYYEYGIGMGLGGNGTKHTGLDVPDEPEAPIYAPIGGLITCEGTGKPGIMVDGTECGAFNDYMGQGNGRIEIKTDSGDIVILGHTSTSLVKVGDRVNIRQQVGTVGGMNGYHTHVEVRVKDPSVPVGWRLVDPIEYFGGL